MDRSRLNEVKNISKGVATKLGHWKVKKNPSPYVPSITYGITHPTQLLQTTYMFLLLGNNIFKNSILQLNLLPNDS